MVKDGRRSKQSVGGDNATPVANVIPQEPGAVDERSMLAAERRQLTVVFIDIVDATALSERLDPEEFFSMVRAYRHVCDRHIRHYGGYIAQTIGDGLLAYFGLPRARENDSECAVHAALAIAADMTKRRFSKTDSMPLKVRIAVNTGTVVVSGGIADSHQREVFGTPVHIAARLQNIAPPNGVVLGPATHDLVAKAFSCEHFGQHDLKGIAHPVTAWLVQGVAATESRFEKTRPTPVLPMIGRISERAKLAELWSEVTAGFGRIAVLSGEPGIGKSRTIQEFRASLTQVETLHLQCSPLHMTAPLAPEIERLRRAAGIRQSDGAARMITKLRKLLAIAVPDSDEAIRYYGALLSIPACDGFTPANLSSVRERDRALETLKRVLLALSRIRPVLMIVEDVQWIDPTSIELFDRVCRDVDRARIFIVITHRAEYIPDWLNRRKVVAIPISKLSDEESEQLVKAVTATQPLSHKFVRNIIERTDGVPLFIEEVSRAFLETRQGQQGQRDVPATIQDLLMERLDSLGDSKRIAQVASIFGPQFEFDGLQFISELSPAVLQRSLDELVSFGAIRPRARSSDTHFVFRHVMIQETAYASMLKEERRSLHARAAAWLNQFDARDESGQLALRGHHYYGAGMIAEAVSAYMAAGSAAMQRSAYKEVIANLSEGLRLASMLKPSPQRYKLEIAFHSKIAIAHAAQKGWWHPHVDEAYGRAVELCRHHGSVRDKSVVLWGLTMARLVSSQLGEALEYARELLALSASSRNDETKLMADASMLVVNFFLGNFLDARHYGQQVFQLYDPKVHCDLVQVYQHDPKIVSLVYAAHVEWLLGCPNCAVTYCQDARLAARQLGHPFMLSYALILGSFDHMYQRNHAANLACVEEGLANAREHKLPLYEVFGPLWAIPAMSERDPSGAVLENLSNLISTLLENKYYLQAPLYQSFLAAEYGRLGAVPRGRDLARLAEDIMRQTGERWFEPEVYRVCANLLAQEPNADPGNALEYFRRALRSAKVSRALGWEIRIASDLANFSAMRGDVCNAIETLAATLERFSAEESSWDLKQAHSLLHKLRLSETSSARA
jgi:class 3 adenylate cyclase/tetratricopeptide (TPR) repeat protein